MLVDQYFSVSLFGGLGSRRLYQKAPSPSLPSWPFSPRYRYDIFECLPELDEFLHRSWPAWLAPNYIDPVTRGDGIVIASAVFGSLATIAIALRAYSKICITRTFGLDDVLILFCLGRFSRKDISMKIELILEQAWSIAMMICLSIASWEYGFNKHIWDVPFDKLRIYNVYSWLFQVTFKLSIDLYQAVIVVVLSTCYRRWQEDQLGLLHDSAIVVLMGVIVVFETAYLIMLFVQCR